MKKVIRIDEQGYHVEDVWVNENEILTDDLIAENVPQGLHTPLWNGTEWVEGKSDTELLEMKRQAKISELENECNKAILGYFKVTLADGNTYSFSYDAEAQRNFGKAGRAFDNGKITEVGWTVYDIEGNRVRIVLNQTDFDTVDMASLSHTNDNISKLRDTLEPQVKIATTETEIEAVKWE